MFGEIHGNKQEYEWLRSLVTTPEFADRVDDIVMEFGNSLYQKSVDRYIAGEDVPVEQAQKAWRNTVGAIGAPSPVSGWLYEAVRETNMKRRGKHQMRVLCGDPYIDWEKVKSARTSRHTLAIAMSGSLRWSRKKCWLSIVGRCSLWDGGIFCAVKNQLTSSRIFAKRAQKRT
jgi:hypothetical protein